MFIFNICDSNTGLTFELSCEFVRFTSTCPTAISTRVHYYSQLYRMLIMISRFKRASFYLGPHRSARHNWLMDRMGYFIFLFRLVIGFFLFPCLSFAPFTWYISSQWHILNIHNGQSTRQNTIKNAGDSKHINLHHNECNVFICSWSFYYFQNLVHNKMSDVINKR